MNVPAYPSLVASSNPQETLVSSLCDDGNMVVDML